MQVLCVMTCQLATCWDFLNLVDPLSKLVLMAKLVRMWLDQSVRVYCSGRSHLLTTDNWLCCWDWTKSHCFGLEPFKHPADVFKEVFSVHTQMMREKCHRLMWNIPSGALLKKHLPSMTPVSLKLHWTKTPQTFWFPGERSCFFLVLFEKVLGRI